MITEDVCLWNISADINEFDIEKIKLYLQEAVYWWCKNCKTEDQTPKWFAACDVGHLLKRVLHHDKRYFNTRTSYTREYQWTGEE